MIEASNIASNKAILADNADIKEEHISKESEIALELNEEEIGHMIEAAIVEANVCEDAFKKTKEQEAVETTAQ